MPMILLQRQILDSLARPRTAIIAAILSLSAAATVATLSDSELGKAVSNGVSGGMKTVAAMLAERSPGQRPTGALASLKHKRQALLSDHALPAAPNVIPPVAALLGTPAAPLVPPAIVPPLVPPPVYTALAGAPPVPLAPPIAGGVPGGVGPILGIAPPLAGGGGGGGGGGIIIPPTVTTATPPPPATTSTVPEPASWAMMLLGFTLVGGAVRKRRFAPAVAT